MTQIQNLTVKGYKSIAKLEAFERCNPTLLVVSQSIKGVIYG
jgi:hypothetical protein